MTPDNERMVVKFLVAALGQGRESARKFCARLPEATYPNLMAAAQAWNQKSCLEASQVFSKLMAPSPFVPSQPTDTKGGGSKRKGGSWTPEMRLRQSRLVKRRMRAKAKEHSQPSGKAHTVHDTTKSASF